MILKVAGTQLPEPSDVTVGQYDLTKSSRTASGLMTMDYIATKHRLDVSWSYLTDSQMSQILSILNSHKPFFTVTFEDADGTKTYTCYCGDIGYSTFHRINGQRYRKDVSVPFIER